MHTVLESRDERLEKRGYIRYTVSIEEKIERMFDKRSDYGRQF